MFVYSIDILSKKSFNHFKEFTNKHYKELVKTLLNDDKIVIERYINNIIKELCVDEINVAELTIIDKLYILLCIRSYNISPKITLNTKTEDEISIALTIDINNTLQIIENLQITHTFEILCDGVTVRGTLPKNTSHQNTLDIVCNCIDTLILKDNTITLTDLTIKQKQDVLNNLPLAILSQITKFLHSQETILSATPVLVFDTNKDLPFEKQIYLSIFNNSTVELIKMLFNTNLRDFYATEYMLFKKFNMPFDAIMNSTPAETNLYFDIIVKDIEQEKQEMQNQDQSQNVPIQSKQHS